MLKSGTGPWSGRWGSDERLVNTSVADRHAYQEDVERLAPPNTNSPRDCFVARLLAMTEMAAVIASAAKQSHGTLYNIVMENWYWVWFNNESSFETNDPSFRNEGKVWPWTKADSVAYFDDLRIMAHGTR
jgi:hypothetical protein